MPIPKPSPKPIPKPSPKPSSKPSPKVCWDKKLTQKSPKQIPIIKKNDICLNMDHCMSWADIMEEEDNRDNTAF